MRALYFLALLAACDDASSGKPIVVDEPPDAFVVVDDICNPLLQIGCGPGQKCSNRTDGNQGFGCKPDGSLAVGAPCADAQEGCAKGGACVGGFCRAFCGPDEAEHPRCAATETCALVFLYGIGACLPPAQATASSSTR